MTDDTQRKRVETAKLAASVILVIIFVITFSQNVLFRKKAVLPADPAATVQADQAQDISRQLITVTNIRTNDKMLEDQAKSWEKEWGRDPFIAQEAVGAIVKAVNLTLNGILWDDRSPKAIVNEKTLLVGDTIYGYTVVSIKPKSVVLRTGEKNIELYVFRPLFSDPGSPA